MYRNRRERQQDASGACSLATSANGRTTFFHDSPRNKYNALSSIHRDSPDVGEIRHGVRFFVFYERLYKINTFLYFSYFLSQLRFR